MFMAPETDGDVFTIAALMKYLKWAYTGLLDELDTTSAHGAVLLIEWLPTTDIAAQFLHGRECSW